MTTGAKQNAIGPHKTNSSIQNRELEVYKSQRDTTRPTLTHNMTHNAGLWGVYTGTGVLPKGFLRENTIILSQATSPLFTTASTTKPLSESPAKLCTPYFIVVCHAGKGANQHGVWVAFVCPHGPSESLPCYIDD